MRKEAENWFKQSKADLKTAKNSFNSKDYYASIFWCQQAVEKALKSHILEKKSRLMKFHDLVKLGKQTKLPEDLLNKCKLLSGIYIETRYGVTEDNIPSEKFNAEEANKFLDIAEEILEWLEKEI